MRSMQQATGIFFSLSHGDREQMLKEILSLDSANASQGTDITTKIIKENADILSDFLVLGLNRSVTTSTFTSRLKQINIPVFQREDKNGQENYWPFNILPYISNIFERFIFKQISNFMEPFCYILVSGKNSITMNVNDFEIEKTECKKLLGIKFDCEVKLQNYLDSVIEKASN